MVPSIKGQIFWSVALITIKELFYYLIIYLNHLILCILKEAFITFLCFWSSYSSAFPGDLPPLPYRPTFNCLYSESLVRLMKWLKWKRKAFAWKLACDMNIHEKRMRSKNDSSKVIGKQIAPSNSPHQATVSNGQQKASIVKKIKL